jgi:ABC-type multidrug transport system fused ATPase/permease subunit
VQEVADDVRVARVEQQARGRFPMLALVRPYRRTLGWGLAALLLDSALNLCKPWPLKVLIDRVLPLAPRPRSGALRQLDAWLDSRFSGRWELLAAVCLATLLIALATGAATYASRKILGRAGRTFAHDLRGRLFAHLQKLSLRFHDAQRSGDLVTRLTSDVATVQEAVTDTGVEVVKNLFQGAALLAVMLALNWRFALVSLWVAPLVAWASARVRSQVRRTARTARASAGLLASVAQETLSSMRLVQALTQERRQEERFQEHNRSCLEATQKGIDHQARLAPAVDLLEAAGLSLVMAVGAAQVWAGAASVGDLVVFLSYLNKLYTPMKSLSKISVVLAKARASSERIGDLLGARPEIVDRPGALQAPRLAGGIEFRDVSFRYDLGRPALARISFRILPGEKVALVGPSGSGKSTLLGLIARLYDPDSGLIQVDGRDVREYRLRSLRGQISLVLQDALLFSGSVADNVAFGCPGAREEDIVRACELADADEFIRKLPDGYRSVLAERGSTLSGGQRTRLALARAILRDAPILLLDEPTTGLDPASEDSVLQSLERASRGKTTILVSHRPRCTRFVDRVLVLDGGRIVECGSSTQLLALGGLYAKLHAETGRFPSPPGQAA